MSTANIDELGKLQAQLKKDGRNVAVEYILAVPEARYGDFADDLKTLPRVRHIHPVFHPFPRVAPI